MGAESSRGPDWERRLRAEVLLLVLLVDSHEAGSLSERAVGYGDVESASPTELEENSRRHQFEGALDAAVAAGVLGVDEAELFASLASGGLEVSPLPADEVSSRRPELERLLRRLSREATAAGDSAEADRALVCLEDAFEAAEQLGVEVDQLRRLGLGGGGDAAGGDVEDDDDWDDEHSRPLPALRAVLPGWSSGGKQIVCVECFDTGLVLRSRTSFEVPDELRGDSDAAHDHFDEDIFELDSEVDVSDDVGTDYWSQGGGGGSGLEGDHLVTTWTWSFSPGVPPEARTLRVSLGDERFEFDVTGVSERPAV